MEALNISAPVSLPTRCKRSTFLKSMQAFKASASRSRSQFQFQFQFNKNVECSRMPMKACNVPPPLPMGAFNIRAKREPGGSRGLQAPESSGKNKRGFSPGPFLYPSPMPLPAPQELRTYFVTSTTANRRRLFQVEENANLLLDVLSPTAPKAAINSTPSSSCPTTCTPSSRPHPTSPWKKQCNTSREASPSASKANSTSGRRVSTRLRSPVQKNSSPSETTSSKILHAQAW
jgi:hypothetical protein